ncbi:MAG TPA: methionyl-tRNA formyltransferase [Candidatus Sphingobacterium stercoripullorum]|nr:methionyl-tRNA formyltransferase [Candidatus Sphingobacterium stercoripullorum]
MRIIFLGTPDFAVASLKALVENNYNVVAVVTAPDRPAGRGRKLREPAVKEFAKAQGIPVLQPVKLRDPKFLEQLKGFNADIQVVVAFRMLPEIVWDMPPLGTINVHASLLPQYRGAAPINHVLINGETETGVTTFKLKHEIDTGGILLQDKISIEKEDNAGSLHDKLMVLGADLLVKTLEKIQDDSVTPTDQSELLGDSEVKHAPKIFKEDGIIDFKNNGEEIINQIRGLSPYPGAHTTLDGKTLKIYHATFEPSTRPLSAGEVNSDGKDYLKISCKDGQINILNLQLEGKKRMAVKDFLKGYRF